MRVHKRTEITVETERLFIIQRRRTIRFWCQECGSEVEMAGLKDAGIISGMTQPLLRHGAQAPKWHFAEGQDGTTLVCLESLLKSM
jgi:hypothetical protein